MILGVMLLGGILGVSWLMLRDVATLQATLVQETSVAAVTVTSQPAEQLKSIAMLIQIFGTSEIIRLIISNAYCYLSKFVVIASKGSIY